MFMFVLKKLLYLLKNINLFNVPSMWCPSAFSIKIVQLKEMNDTKFLANFIM